MLYNFQYEKGLYTMTKMILSLLLMLASASALLAEHTLSAPFVGYTTYNDSQLESGYDVGVFSQTKDENATYNIFLNYNHLTNVGDTNETNATSDEETIKNISISLLKKYNLADDLKLLTAINYNLSTDDRYDQVFSVLGGLEKSMDIIKFGANVSYSKFNDDALAKSTTQVSPYFAFYFGHPNSVMGNFYTKIMYDTILLNSLADTTMSKRYRSHALNITHFKHGFETNVQLWFGETLYALRSNGLVNQFLNIKYKDSALVSVKYNLSDTIALQLSSLSQTYMAIEDTEDSKLKTYILAAYFKF